LETNLLCCLAGAVLYIGCSERGKSTGGQAALGPREPHPANPGRSPPTRQNSSLEHPNPPPFRNNKNACPTRPGPGFLLARRPGRPWGAAPPPFFPALGSRWGPAGHMPGPPGPAPRKWGPPCAAPAGPPFLNGEIPRAPPPPPTRLFFPSPRPGNEWSPDPGRPWVLPRAHLFRLFAGPPPPPPPRLTPPPGFAKRKMIGHPPGARPFAVQGNS